MNCLKTVLKLFCSAKTNNTKPGCVIEIKVLMLTCHMVMEKIQQHIHIVHRLYYSHLYCLFFSIERLHAKEPKNLPICYLNSSINVTFYVSLSSLEIRCRISKQEAIEEDMLSLPPQR